MLKKVPDHVMDWLKKEAKTKGTIRVDIEVYHDDSLTHLATRHGLSFSYDLKFHGANGFTYGIEDYLLQTLNYTRRYIKILVNGMDLAEIKLPQLLPPEIPPEIDLSNTTS